MHSNDNGLNALADMLWPDSEVKALLDIADAMKLSERLVDMNQVVELTTLSLSRFSISRHAASFRSACR